MTDIERGFEELSPEERRQRAGEAVGETLHVHFMAARLSVNQIKGHQAKTAPVLDYEGRAPKSGLFEVQGRAFELGVQHYPAIDRQHAKDVDYLKLDEAVLVGDGNSELGPTRIVSVTLEKIVGPVRALPGSG